MVILTVPIVFPVVTARLRSIWFGSSSSDVELG